MQVRNCSHEIPYRRTLRRACWKAPRIFCLFLRLGLRRLYPLRHVGSIFRDGCVILVFAWGCSLSMCRDVWARQPPQVLRPQPISVVCSPNICVKASGRHCCDLSSLTVLQRPPQGLIIVSVNPLERSAHTNRRQRALMGMVGIQPCAAAFRLPLLFGQLATASEARRAHMNMGENPATPIHLFRAVPRCTCDM